MNWGRVERSSAARAWPGGGREKRADFLENPTLGEVAVILLSHPRSKTFAGICPSRALRTCEALRIWSNHHAVETFWKRMKSWLGLGRMQVRGRAGA